MPPKKKEESKETPKRVSSSSSSSLRFDYPECVTNKRHKKICNENGECEWDFS